MYFTVQTIERSNLDRVLADVKSLLGLVSHKSTPTRSPFVETQPEVVRRVGIILTVTAWETFIEDTIKREFEEKLKNANSPQDVQKAFNTVADAWLQSKPRSPKHVEQWTGDMWKKVVSESFTKKLQSLNTPSPENVRKISKRYLGMDVTSHWKWRGVSTKAACSRLKRLLSLRGELVHRAKDLFDKGNSVKLAKVNGAIQLVERLSQRTEEAFGCAPQDLE